MAMSSAHADTVAIGEIIAAEHALYKAMLELDYGALERILSPDLVYVHSTGVAETRSEYLAALAKGAYQYETIESHDVGVRMHGDCAVANGSVAMRVRAFGSGKTLIHLLFVLVWVKPGERWQLSYRQATRIP